MSRGRVTVSCERLSNADAATIFELLSDSSTYPRWSAIDAYEMERPGTSAPHGIGEVRVFKSKLKAFPLVTFVVREEVVDLVRNRFMAYTLLSGLPMRNYRGETSLEPLDDGGTRIIWQSSFDHRPVMGWVMKQFMKWVLATLTTALAKAAESERASRTALQTAELIRGPAGSKLS